jgi:hypothetical protein
VEPVASRLLEVFADPLPFTDGAEVAGEPVAVLPVLFICCGRTS